VRANSAAPYFRDPSAKGAPFLLGKTSIEVEHEDLTIRCVPAEQDEACTFEAVYALRGAPDRAEEVLGAFVGLGRTYQQGTPFSARLGDKDARADLTAEQQQSIARAALDLDPSLSGYRKPADLRGFRVALGPGERRTLVFSGALLPVYWENPHAGGGLVYPARLGRHPGLGRPERRPAARSYAYALSPLLSWAGAPQISITVRAAAGAPLSIGSDGWAASPEGGEQVLRRTLRPADLPVLELTVTTPGNGPFYAGGPFLGIGKELSGGPLRLRAGWEVGVSSFGLAQLAVESDASQVLTLVPAVEVATPGIVFVPSLGLALGVPVQFKKGADTRVGGRVQLTLSLFLLSVVLPIDFYGAGADAALLGQLSF
jgi:hypothetical protein